MRVKQKNAKSQLNAVKCTLLITNYHVKVYTTLSATVAFRPCSASWSGGMDLKIRLMTRTR
jgi:hypothetical protein